MSSSRSECLTTQTTCLQALAEQSLAKTLAKRPTENVDGGRRVVKNIIYRAQLGVMHLKSMRAVRDKLPRGRYVIHVSLFDRLGGNALCWSKLERERVNDVTSYVEHGGDHRDVDLELDQSLRLVLPSHVMLAPSMAFVFELHQLQEKQFESYTTTWPAPRPKQTKMSIFCIFYQ